MKPFPALLTLLAVAAQGVVMGQAPHIAVGALLTFGSRQQREEPDGEAVIILQKQVHDPFSDWHGPWDARNGTDYHARGCHTLRRRLLKSRSLAAAPATSPKPSPKHKTPKSPPPTKLSERSPSPSPVHSPKPSPVPSPASVANAQQQHPPLQSVVLRSPSPGPSPEPSPVPSPTPSPPPSPKPLPLPAPSPPYPPVAPTSSPKPSASPPKSPSPSPKLAPSSPSPSPKPSPAASPKSSPTPSPNTADANNGISPSPVPGPNEFFSSTYGRNGELWDPSDRNTRLMDWSYAGYGAGEQPIPNSPVSCSVMDYGAVGDGSNDDSNAFLQAINDTSCGVIYIPPGRYILSVQLVITRPGVSLRGAGPNQTTLWFVKSLTDMYGNTWSGGQFAENGNADTFPMSEWMNAPGLIRFLGPGPDAWQPLTSITAAAQRIDNQLAVASTTGLRPGMWVSIAQQDDGSLYSVLNPKPVCSKTNKCIAPGPGGVLRFHSRIAQIGPGRTITLERRLPFNITLSAKPTIYRFMQGMQNVGVDNLTIEMKWQWYEGHFLEAGWNGIEFSDVSQCWARNVTIINGDTLLSFYRSSFCTVSGFTASVTQTRVRRGSRNPGFECHHGLNVSASQDILLANNTFTISCQHDVSVFNYTGGVVVANTTGTDLNPDHHRFYPHAVLWSNITLGLAKRAFVGAGITTWGEQAAALCTFWNVGAANGRPLMVIPGWDSGPLWNYIGVNLDPAAVNNIGKLLDPVIPKGMNWVMEPLPAQRKLVPAELYTSMLQQRLSQQAGSDPLEQPS